MATITNWARHTWRAKPITCDMTSTGLSWKNLGEKPCAVSFTLERDTGEHAVSIEVSFHDMAEIKDLLHTLSDYVSRHGEGGK